MAWGGEGLSEVRRRIGGVEGFEEYEGTEANEGIGGNVCPPCQLLPSSAPMPSIPGPPPRLNVIEFTQTITNLSFFHNNISKCLQ